MGESTEKLRQLFNEDLSAITDMETWKAVRDKYLSRDKGVITREIKKLRSLPEAERPAFGQAMNRLRSLVEEKLQERLAAIKMADAESRRQHVAHPHPK